MNLLQGRARSVVRNGRVAHYTPDNTVRYENLVKLAAQQAMGGSAPIEVACALVVREYFAIPASWSLKKQRAAALGEIWKTTKPDIDNVIKAVKDGCNKVVWRDDSQVTDLVSCKRYGTPRVEVEVRALYGQFAGANK